MLDDLRVLEVEGSVAGGYAAKLLADHGAQVVTWKTGAGAPIASTTGMSSYLGQGKTVVARLPEGLLEAADVVIESSAVDPLTPRFAGVDAEPHRIHLEISPFGSTGPSAGRRSTDLTDQALSGHLYLNGDPDREPVQGPDHQVAYAAGTHGAIGVLAAVLVRRTIGRGQRVVVTHLQTMVAMHQFTLLRYTHNGDILTRMGNRYAGPGRPIGMYRCGSGMISLVAPRSDQVESLLAVTGLLDLLDEPGIEGTHDLMHHPTLLDRHLVPWLEQQDLDETIDLFQTIRVPAGKVAALTDVLDHPSLNQRRYWRELSVGPDPVRAPGPVARVEVTGSAGPVRARDASLADGPLAGIRVVDLTRVWAGPYATRLLADLGADVIMVEAPWARGGATIDRTSVLATRYYPDNEPGERHWNRIGFSNKYNLNKRNIAIDLNTAAGIEILESLVAWADVLIENFSPRVMPNFGLDQQRLHQLNPSLISVTMPGFGRTGPARDHIAYGPIIDSEAGLSALMGYEGESARKGGVAWPDPVAGMHAAFATLAALHARDGDGAGRTVEVAQLEATVAMIGHALIDAQLNGGPERPQGNRHPSLAPSGVYRCRGTDRWVALSVVDDRGWAALCELGRFDPSWRHWNRDRRREEHDRIDSAISRWTSDGQQDEVVGRLQERGVAAAPVADAAQVMADPHLAAQRFFVSVDHPEAGTHRWPGVPIALDRTPATYRRPSPMLNEHGDEILTELLGYDRGRIEGLLADRVITGQPPE